jgi:hypothetical protein
LIPCEKRALSATITPAALGVGVQLWHRVHPAGTKIASREIC